MNGRYTSFAAPICDLTSPCTEAKLLSSEILHRLGIIFLLLLAIKCSPSEIYTVIIVYSPRFVRLRLMYPSTGRFREIRLVTSNCSSGE